MMYKTFPNKSFYPVSIHSARHMFLGNRHPQTGMIYTILHAQHHQISVYKPLISLEYPLNILLSQTRVSP